MTIWRASQSVSLRVCSTGDPGGSLRSLFECVLPAGKGSDGTARTPNR